MKCLHRLCILGLTLAGLVCQYAYSQDAPRVTTNAASPTTQPIEVLRKAAEQGDAEAQFNLGVCYYTGKGMERDESEAVKWFRKAAEQGYANAQYNLGSCYRTGIGTEPDQREAVKWYRKAAEQGNAVAQCSLGTGYFSGTGRNSQPAIMRQ